MKGKAIRNKGMGILLFFVLSASSGCSLFKSNSCDCPSWSQETPANEQVEEVSQAEPLQKDAS